MKKLIIVSITRNTADKLSSKKPILKYNVLSIKSQSITSLLINILVEDVTYKRQIEYTAQIPVEIRVKFLVKCFERKLGTVKLSVIKKATHIGKNINIKAFEKIKFVNSTLT